MSVLESENLNILWASIIVEELIRNGINYFCVSPGSRSSPLTISVARNRNAKLVMCYDERGAAFHALGFARATHRPAVVITTSGTAVANCFPAVVEASMECVPIILLTADRPPELQDTKANQTIDQDHIFGRYVRYFFNLPPPEPQLSPHIPLTTVDQAIFRAVSKPEGPVHINCMFREPLSPEKKELPDGYTDCLKSWVKKDIPYTSYKISEVSISEEEVKEVCKLINSAENGLIIAGRINAKKRDAVLKLIKKTKWPVFSDIRSHLPYFLSKNIVPFFSLLLSSAFPDVLFDVVLHIGGVPISKHIMQFLEEKRPVHYVVVKEDPFRQDMHHISTMHIQTDIEKFCLLALPYLNPKKSSSFDMLVKISSEIKKLLSRLFRKNELNEASLAYWISKVIPEKSALFLSNSMPIRDMDMYGSLKKKDVLIGANRGASGIDGIIATATGFATGAKRITTLIIGDVAFIHDLNSLFLLRKTDVPLILILINNNGGGIFSFLPISAFSELCERYFVAPHNISSFKKLVSFFDIPYFSVSKREELIGAYKQCLERSDSAVIEVKIDREKNLSFHRLVQTKIKEILKRKDERS